MWCPRWIHQVHMHILDGQEMWIIHLVKKLKLLVKNQIKCDIKRSRTDGGGEYTSTKVAQFCKKKGIEH